MLIMFLFHDTVLASFFRSGWRYGYIISFNFSELDPRKGICSDVMRKLKMQKLFGRSLPQSVVRHVEVTGSAV